MASLNAVTQWDQQYDLVIAGFGLASMCAAIEAHDLDPNLSILILEKANEAETGGNSRVAVQCTASRAPNSGNSSTASRSEKPVPWMNCAPA